MSKEAMKLALEALTATMATHGFREHIEEAQDKAIKALEEALANHCEDNLDMVKQEQGEPVAWMRKDEVKAMTDIEKQAWIASDQGVDGYWSEVVKDYSIPLYTAPQQRKPLTDEQIEKLMDNYDVASLDYARAIEAAHGIKEKNT